MLRTSNDSRGMLCIAGKAQIEASDTRQVQRMRGQGVIAAKSHPNL